jgi:hypothetical protein
MPGFAMRFAHRSGGVWPTMAPRTGENGSADTPLKRGAGAVHRMLSHQPGEATRMMAEGCEGQGEGSLGR